MRLKLIKMSSPPSVLKKSKIVLVVLGQIPLNYPPGNFFAVLKRRFQNVAPQRRNQAPREILFFNREFLKKTGIKINFMKIMKHQAEKTYRLAVLGRRYRNDKNDAQFFQMADVVVFFFQQRFGNLQPFSVQNANFYFSRLKIGRREIFVGRKKSIVQPRSVFDKAQSGKHLKQVLFGQ